MKRILNKILYRFGYRISEVPEIEYQVQEYIDNNIFIESAEEAQEAIQLALSQINRTTEWDIPETDNYLSTKRIAFYNSVINKCLEHHIRFRDARIADLGCGSGYLLRALSILDTPACLHGYDHNPLALVKGKHLCPEGEFFKNNLLKDSIEEEYDIIFITEVLEHVAYPEQIIQSLSNNLSDGGKLIITVPDGRMDRLGIGKSLDNNKIFTGHVNFWSPESWEIFLNKSGYLFTTIKASKVENAPHDGNFGILYR